MFLTVFMHYYFPAGSAQYLVKEAIISLQEPGQSDHFPYSIIQLPLLRRIERDAPIG